MPGCVPRAQNGSITHLRYDPKTPHTNDLPQHAAPKNRKQQQPNLKQRPSNQTATPACNRSVAPFCVAPTLTAALSLRSTKSLPSVQPQPPTPTTAQIGQWITCAPVQTLSSTSMPVTRFSKLLLTPSTLSCPKLAAGRAAAHCHLGWHDDDRVNGAIDVPCKTIKNVVSSASEAETGGICQGGRRACPHPCHARRTGPQTTCC